MPDPGEPHPPVRHDFDDDGEFLRAMNDYVDLTWPPNVIAKHINDALAQIAQEEDEPCDD